MEIASASFACRRATVSDASVHCSSSNHSATTANDIDFVPKRSLQLWICTRLTIREWIFVRTVLYLIGGRLPFSITPAAPNEAWLLHNRQKHSYSQRLSTISLTHTTLRSFRLVCGCSLVWVRFFAVAHSTMHCFCDSISLPNSTVTAA